LAAANTILAGVVWQVRILPARRLWVAGAGGKIY